MSQRTMILRHLESGYPLTALEALRRYGCMSLSQRVGELRRAGYPIIAESWKLTGGKRVARYRWAEGGQI